MYRYQVCRYQVEGMREYNDYYNVYGAIIIILHDMCVQHIATGLTYVYILYIHNSTPKQYTRLVRSQIWVSDSG